jgi:hypothetical protein
MVRLRTRLFANVVIANGVGRAANAKTANEGRDGGNNGHLVASLSRQTITPRMASTMQS